MDWSRWPNFSANEFKCSHTGLVMMSAAFLDALQALRLEVGQPFIINSGYRHPSHPVEAVKPKPGVHTLGIAADIAADTQLAYRLVSLASRYGFLGIGVSQRDGQGRFVHLDTWTGKPRPNIWSY